MSDFEGIRQRLIKIQQDFKLKDTAFAKICKISHTSIANIVKGRSAGFDVTIVARISKALNINAHWIITGEGDIQIPLSLVEEGEINYEKKININTSNKDTKSSEILPSDDKLLSENIELNNLVKISSQELSYLKSKLADKEEIIQLLKTQLENK